jgi:uncharacterized membrane protein YkoI
MKTIRVIALAAVALLVVGALTAFTFRAFAQRSSGPTVQAQDCATQGNDTGQVQSTDTDQVEVHCGQQDAADGGKEQDKAAGVHEGQDAAPAGTPSISAQAAQKTAEAFLKAGTATEVELDDENGTLVYSVEINGKDVKVNAMTGVVMGTD